MTKFVLLAAVLLSACGNPPRDVPEKQPGEVSAVTQLVAGDAALSDAVDYGVAWWSDAGHDDLVRVEECDGSQPCAVIRWATGTELAANVGGLTSGDRRLVVMNRALQTLTYLPPLAIQISVAHEIGHVRGLGHVSEPTELMDTHSSLKGEICIAGEACRDL